MAAAHISNGVAHFDISGPDLPALADFYGSVFGWSVDVKGPGYALIETPAGSADGALVESDEASLMLGIAVPDLDAALTRAVEMGGAVAMPATDNGWVTKARIADPAGNVITLIQA